MPAGEGVSGDESMEFNGGTHADSSEIGSAHFDPEAGKF